MFEKTPGRQWDSGVIITTVLHVHLFINTRFKNQIGSECYQYAESVLRATGSIS